MCIVYTGIKWSVVLLDQLIHSEPQLTGRNITYSNHRKLIYMHRNIVEQQQQQQQLPDYCVKQETQSWRFILL